MAVKLLSYNSTGFNSIKGDFINFLSLINGIDFVFVQEHFHLRENIPKIKAHLKDFNSAFIPASKTSDFISAGRPSGGLGIFWRHSLDSAVNIINHPNSTRVHAVSFDSKYLLVNCYFPVDPKTALFNDFELLKVLEDIKWFIDSYPNYSIVLVGDVNCDFSRTTRFVNIIREFMMRNQLMTVWSAFPVDFTFSQSQNRNGREVFSHSVIDHFLINTADFHNVLDAQVIHTGDNLSVHEPIFLTLKTDFVANENVEAPIDNEVPKPMWSKASPENIASYREELSARLSSLELVNGLLCNNPKCQDAHHLSDIDSFANDIMKIIDSSVNSCIPLSRSPAQEKVVPGWTDVVKPYQDDAKFWYAIWLSCGKPRNCEVHNVMKRTRNAYHYAVRRVKKNAAQIKQDKLIDSLKGGGSANLLKEFKKQRLGNVNNFASKIDGISGNNNIANHFSNLYSNLYSRNKSEPEMKVFLDNLNDSININDLSEIDRVTPAIVFQAISSLHKNKSDNTYAWKSDAIIYGGDILSNYFTLLFHSFLLHGYVPKSLLSCTLKPIIKDSLGDKFSSSNYRAIGISPLILKVLDLVILIIFGNDLTPSELQFGFQKDNSTTMCTWVVCETVNYFNNRDTPVFSCFLDISKAFDLVNFHKLFQKLIGRISPMFLRLLAYIYMQQVCKVEWNGQVSNSFNVYNGVRQGAVLSPTFFSIYINELFSILKSSGLGCYIKNCFYGIVGYADDLVLLSPDIKGLQYMLDLTSNYLKSIGLCVSVDHVKPHKSKTKCVSFGLKHDPIPIKLDGISLPWCDRYIHLGHLLYKDGTLDLDCDMKCKSFTGSFHALRQELKSQDPFVLLNLINIYISHFYGSNLWNLFNCDQVYILWNNMIRNVFNLPQQTHRYLIEPISETHHVFSMLTNRFIKFFLRLYSSDKLVIRNLCQLQLFDMRSTFGSNILHICLAQKILNPLNMRKDLLKYKEIPDSEIWRVNFIKDVLSVRLNSRDQNILSLNELNQVLFCISCN